MTEPFPNGLIGTKAELFYSGQWNDHTEDVRGLGAQDGEVKIGARGQPDESSGIITTVVRLAVNNNNGKYSPRNVLGDLYGLIGRNTPLRISADVAPIQSVIDQFNVDSASGWPDSESGHDYTHSGASASQFIVSGGEAYHRHAAAGTIYQSELSSVLATNFDVLIEGVRLEAVVTGAAFAQVIVRVRVENGNWVSGYLLYTVGGANPVDIGMGVATGFSVTNVDNNTIPGVTHTDSISFRLQVRREVCRVRAWETGTTEPTTWDVEGTTPNTLPGLIEIETELSSGVTNAMPFDCIIGSIDFSLGISLCSVEVAEWPKRWDSTGNDVWVPIVATGLTRRLKQGNSLLRSALFRKMMALSLDDDVIGYWDMENLSGTVNTMLSALPDGGGLSGTERDARTTWSADSSLAGSGALPTTVLGDTANGAQRLDNGGLLSTSASNDTWTVVFFNYAPISDDIDNVSADTGVDFKIANSSSIRRWLCRITHSITAGVKETTVDAFAFDHSNVLIAGASINAEVTDYDDGWHMYRFTANRDGSGHHIRAYKDEVLIAIATDATAPIVGQPQRVTRIAADVTSSQFPISYGHFAWASGATTDVLTTNASGILEAAFGYDGELASARFARICTEEGIPFEVIQADAEVGTRCGPQKELNIVDMLLEPVRADDGVMYELRDELGYGFKTRESLQLPDTTDVFTLDYSAAEISEDLEVTDDDQRIVNQVTVSRLHGGETATVSQTTGPLSISNPTDDPPGAGLYPVQVSPNPNLYDADQVLDYAGQRLHLGTWDEDRWPAIKVQLHRDEFTSNVALLLSAAFLEIAEIMSIVNTPSWLGPDNVLLQMRAVNIFLSNFNWGLEWLTLPAGPWTTLGVLNNPALGRLDTHGSEVVTTVDSNDTEILVFTTHPNLPHSDVTWTMDMGELTTHDSTGIDLRLNPPARAGGQGGEKITVPVDYELTDTFTRTATEVVGTNADTGQTWVLVDGPSAEMSVTGTRLRHGHDSVNDILWASIDADTMDQCLQTDLYFASDTALTSSIIVILGLRHTDANNYYGVVVSLLAGTSNVALRVTKTIASVTTDLTNNYTYLTNVASTAIRIKAMVFGRWIAAKIWRPDLGNEPEWQVSMVDAAGEMMIAESVSIRSRLETGNTNTLTYNIDFDNLRVHSPKILPAYYDYFNRTTSNGLGTANSGGAWTTLSSGGSILASDYQVVPNEATTLLAAAGSLRGGFLAGISLQDVCVSYTFTMPVPTGATLLTQILFRGTDDSPGDYRMLRVTISTAAAITLEFRSVIGGVSASLGSVVVPYLTHSATVPLRVKALAQGTELAAKIWDPASTMEPRQWYLTATDPAVASGWVGFRHDRSASNTNTNPTPAVRDFKVDNPQRMIVTRNVNGGAREWSNGTDVRLWSPLILAR